MLTRTLKTGLALSLLATLVTFPTSSAQAAPSNWELASYWAPDFYQDTHDTHGHASDYVTSFNYDGDWSGLNNWENLYNYPLAANVYYQVVETGTHWFISYYTFHPRDDGPLAADRHENDLEGCLLVVRKDGSTYGSFQLMETQAHNQIYQYTNDGSITNGSDNIDGGVRFRDSHPGVFIQPNGQSPWGGHGVHAWDGSGAPGGDGIVYYHGDRADVPTSGAGNYANWYSYKLLSVDELWDRRNWVDGNTFASWGAFAGDTYEQNSAKAPWGWDDPDDGPTFTGDWFADPAHMVDTHLNNLGTFSHQYVYHPYFTHKLSVFNVTSRANRDTFGGKSDIFVRLYAAGEVVADARLWKKNDAPIGTRYGVYWGYTNAEFNNQYTSAYNARHVAKPPYTEMKVDVHDSDGTSSDDFMGSLAAYLAPGQTQQWVDAYNSRNEAQVTATFEAVR